jgi:hypothetical protein
MLTDTDIIRVYLWPRLASPAQTWIEYIPQSIAKDIEREHCQRDEHPWSNSHVRGEHEES